METQECLLYKVIQYRDIWCYLFRTRMLVFWDWWTIKGTSKQAQCFLEEDSHFLQLFDETVSIRFTQLIRNDSFIEKSFMDMHFSSAVSSSSIKEEEQDGGNWTPRRWLLLRCAALQVEPLPPCLKVLQDPRFEACWMVGEMFTIDVYPFLDRVRTLLTHLQTATSLQKSDVEKLNTKVRALRILEFLPKQQPHLPCEPPRINLSGLKWLMGRLLRCPDRLLRCPHGLFGTCEGMAMEIFLPLDPIAVNPSRRVFTCCLRIAGAQDITTGETQKKKKKNKKPRWICILKRRGTISSSACGSVVLTSQHPPNPIHMHKAYQKDYIGVIDEQGTLLPTYWGERDQTTLSFLLRKNQPDQIMETLHRFGHWSDADGCPACLCQPYHGLIQHLAIGDEKSETDVVGQHRICHLIKQNALQAWQDRRGGKQDPSDCFTVLTD